MEDEIEVKEEQAESEDEAADPLVVAEDISIEPFTPFNSLQWPFLVPCPRFCIFLSVQDKFLL